MNLLALSHPARWLVLPITVTALIIAPPKAALLGVCLVLAMVIVGFTEQAVRLGDVSARRRWIINSLALGVLLVIVAARIEWVLGAEPYLVGAMYGLCATSGWLFGALCASLWSKQALNRPDGEGSLLASRDDAAPLGVVGLLSRADKLTVLREPSTQRLPTTHVAEPRSVEVLVNGSWRRATLDSWETRELGLYAHVIIHDGPTETGWVSADLLRINPAATDDSEQLEQR